MSIHLTRDLEELHRDIISMCAMVEDLIHRAVQQLSEPSSSDVQELAERDRAIDLYDVRIEENCLKILALHQPVAVDLRRITAVLKISSELERVADLAVHIAERATGFAWSVESVPPGPDGLRAGGPRSWEIWRGDSCPRWAWPVQPGGSSPWRPAIYS